ncbi:MAG: HEAT repeat domain-containing protein [Anaerolineales bacterium]|nr:HEAT repeat domain-containing protein [Anaerolineales bacterium]
MPFLFALDPISFLIGFITATIFWFIVGRARPIVEELRESMKARREEAQARRTSSIEENHRRATLRRAQGMHLAAQLFALDEILQEPLLLAPPQRVEPGTTPKFEDVITQTLPYLHTWPEIAAIYQPQTLTLPQAISGNVNIAIIGQAGAGKTVALAHLASLAANRSEKMGGLQNLVPFLIHVADLKLPHTDEKNVLEPIIEAAAEHASLFDYNKLSAFINTAFRNGNSLLLVDGYDEITPDEQTLVSNFFKLVLQNYPETKIVTTGAPEYLDGLIPLGFAPLAITAWSPNQNQKFLEQWGQLWNQTVAKEAWSQTAMMQPVDPLLLNAWLGTDLTNLSPLELTLTAWGAYAGDSLGPHVLEVIATHIRRIAPENTPVAALETLAMQVILSAQPVFDPRQARAWVKSFEVIENESVAETSQPSSNEADGEDAKSDTQKMKKIEKVSTPSTSLLDKMAESGLLVPYPNHKMRFIHAVFAGYLAGHAMTNYSAEDNILNQPDWSGKYLTLRYFAAHGDASKVVQSLLEFSRLPMHRPLFAAARWLRDAPKNAQWRGKMFGTLAAILQSEGLPLSLRGQAMAAFVYSNDPSASALFRQMINTPSFELVHLAVLGAGAMGDVKAIKILEMSLQAPSLSVRRAACMALVAINTNESLEIVAQTLLGGDEDIRRAAGEAIANDTKEGHAMLKDGITINDILLRRAVVYGLGRIHEDWAIELLKKIQIEDEQWVVRNAATEVLDSKLAVNSLAPTRLNVPHETPWLIEFAAKKGLGVSPGTPATDIFLLALKEDDPDARLAALPYLKYHTNEGVITQIYNAMYKDDPELREAAFLTLWEMGASGVKLPHPSQYGLG